MKRDTVFRAGILAAMLAATAGWMTSTVSAQGASQIVLSCTTPGPHSQDPNGCRSSELVTTPPIIQGNKLLIVGGFWVWCQSPTNGTPYGPDCNGAMYVAEVDLASGAGVYNVTSISGTSTVGGATGLEVTFKSSDGDTSCTLDVPTSPTTGQSNTLIGACNGVPIVFSSVVAHVT